MKKLLISLTLFSSVMLLGGCCGTGCGSSFDYATSYSTSSGCCGATTSCCGAGGW